MTSDPKKMTCMEFQTELAELLNSGEDLFLNPHVQTCERCRRLVPDLEIASETVRKLNPGEGPFIH